MEEKLCVLLEYTRVVDTNEDWAEKKEQEKNDRYSSLLGFINHLSYREKSGWKASQTNFTTGVRGSLHTNQFLTRLESLGVKNGQRVADPISKSCSGDPPTLVNTLPIP